MVLTDTVTSEYISTATATATESVTMTEVSISTMIQPTTYVSVWVSTEIINNVSK